MAFERLQVAYAEALRLLHDLVDYLEHKEEWPLPDLPFPANKAIHS